MAVPGVVVGTCILIRYFRTPAARRASTELAIVLSVAPCYVTYITIYELFFDAIDQVKRQDADDAILPLKVIGESADVARRAGLLRPHLVQAGWDIGVMDPLVAAACLEANLPILTTNIDHFLRVPGLVVLSPNQIVPKTTVEYLLIEAQEWNAGYRRRYGYDRIPALRE